MYIYKYIHIYQIFKYWAHITRNLEDKKASLACKTSNDRLLDYYRSNRLCSEICCSESSTKFLQEFLCTGGLHP